MALLLLLGARSAAGAPTVALPERFTTRVTGRFEHGYNTDDDPGAPELYMDVSVLWAQDARPGRVPRSRFDSDTHQRCGKDVHRWLHSTATGNGTTVDYDYGKKSCVVSNGSVAADAVGSVYRWAPREWTLGLRCEDTAMENQTLLRYENVTERFLRSDLAYDEPGAGEPAVRSAVYGFASRPCNDTHNSAAHDVYVVDGLPRKETYKFYNGWDIVTHVVSYAPFVVDFGYGDDMDDLLSVPEECAP